MLYRNSQVFCNEHKSGSSSDRDASELPSGRSVLLPEKEWSASFFFSRYAKLTEGPISLDSNNLPPTFPSRRQSRVGKWIAQRTSIHSFIHSKIRTNFDLVANGLREDIGMRTKISFLFYLVERYNIELLLQRERTCSTYEGNII